MRNLKQYEAIHSWLDTSGAHQAKEIIRNCVKLVGSKATGLAKLHT